MLTSVFGLVFAYGLVSRFKIPGIVGGYVVTGLIRNGTAEAALLRWLLILCGAATSYVETDLTAPTRWEAARAVR